MKIGIVVTCFNELEYTKNMVYSIKTKYPHELIIIDDYSIDGTKAWLRELKARFEILDAPFDTTRNLTVLSDPDTTSLGEKWNLGALTAQQLGCEAVLICNNDILFNPKTIDNLVERLELSRKLGQNIALVSASNQRGHIKPEEILELQLSEMNSEAEHPDFSCFLLDLKAWEFVGKFSQDYKPCYFEDNDFHTMLRIHGLVGIAITSAPYYHYGSITQNSVVGGLCKGPQFESNRQIFVDKFGVLPDKIDIKEVQKQFNITPITSLNSIP
jgi:GT2 family glycosyltransferase